MSALDRIRISHRLALLSLIPAVALLCLLLAGILQKWNESTEVVMLERLTRFAVVTSEFVHESQKERGATGVYMGSGGARYRTELDAQRQLAHVVSPRAGGRG